MPIKYLGVGPSKRPIKMRYCLWGGSGAGGGSDRLENADRRPGQVSKVLGVGSKRQVQLPACEPRHKSKEQATFGGLETVLGF